MRYNESWAGLGLDLFIGFWLRWIGAFAIIIIAMGWRKPADYSNDWITLKEKSINLSIVAWFVSNLIYFFITLALYVAIPLGIIRYNHPL